MGRTDANIKMGKGTGVQGMVSSCGVKELKVNGGTEWGQV